ncbi:3'-5' exonuclease [Thiosulfatimonas sediminis]|uniref:3'-5' exonuclease n=1 Tax=Thiosulfatimonas sediminis TaxID=2675054 RepID=A0A6F8PV73_9GAMM|nr:3'-5' exonuclease [Thiosulfatimonas sediminis]BBP46031.1 3'-5' exonuclease [Thiosulfatimonas sediminis]
MFARLQKWISSRRLAKMRQQLKQEHYAFLFDLEPGVFVCFDCETTGLNRNKDRIITLSAIKIVGNQILTSQSLNLAIKQQQQISSESIEIHQIRNVDVANNTNLYEDEMQAMQEFLHFIGGATLVGYYLDFDVSMVNRIIKPKIGIGLPNPQIEVSGMFYEYMRQKYKRSCVEPNIDLAFATIIEKLKIPQLGQHDAFNDALMTALVFVKLQSLQNNS